MFTQYSTKVVTTTDERLNYERLNGLWRLLNGVDRNAKPAIAHRVLPGHHHKPAAGWHPSLKGQTKSP